MSGEFNTPPIPASKLEAVLDAFEPHLEQIESIDNSETAPLGSTRSILIKGSDTAPEKAGDIDLVVLARDRQDTLLDIRGDLTAYFEDEGLPHKHFFKNIFSVAFENDITGEPVQVDLVISERDPGGKMYRYLRDLKYFSSPESNLLSDTGFEVKGLHRTELVRSFARIHGLSMATRGFAAYVWAPGYDTFSDLMDRLEDKHSRTRSNENLSMLEDLMDFIQDRFSSLDEIRDELFGKSPLLKRKYLINRAGVGPVNGKYAAKTIEHELTNMRSLEHIDWEHVMEKFMSLERFEIETFESTRRNLSACAIPERKVRQAVLDYEAKLSGDGYWNEELERILEDSFSIEIN